MTLRKSKFTFGPWTYDPKRDLLRHANGYECYWGDEVTPSTVLGWLAQVQEKTWADDATVAGLARAFHALVNLHDFARRAHAEASR